MRDLIDDRKDDDYWWYSGGYADLVDSFEVETIFDEHDDDYQGDSYYLLKDGDKFGILIFGWGSCSGCDALQGCYTFEEVVTLRDELWQSISWDTLDATKTWVESHDFGDDWYSYRDAGRKFANRLYEYFGIDKEITSEC